VLFVGNVAANKGVMTACEAVLSLRERHPGLRLQILGTGDDDLIHDLQERARRENAADSIEVHGFVSVRERLPAFYRAADVVCSPAVHEVGVANVYIEAMAAGCPVVAADSGAAPEAIVQRETGLLVPPDDVGATAAALHEILADAGLRERLGAAGRRRAEEYFAMDHYVARVLASYQRALVRSPG
jgi:glycosyltransferase involved in cell wall biosynthesis